MKGHAFERYVLSAVFIIENQDVLIFLDPSAPQNIYTAIQILDREHYI